MKTIKKQINQQIEINIELIQIGSNYRTNEKPITDASLEELVQSIKQYGVVQAILVRPGQDGKYELVSGERRVRASILAGKNSIPAMIRSLSDQEMKEIQLIENLQRENPHPMAEAILIHQLLQNSKAKNKMEEIAKRIGKSVSFIFQRNKLYDLVPALQEMFLADKLTMTQSLKLSRLEQKAQQDFVERNCSDWKEEGWEMQNFERRIGYYETDLDDAPFDITDALLYKKAGACTKCQNNTAVTTSLFPEDSTDARCTNGTCFQEKCRLTVLLNIHEMLVTHPDLPIAFDEIDTFEIYSKDDNKLLKDRTILIEDRDFNYYDEIPDKPIMKDFDHYESEEDKKLALADALEEHEAEMEDIERAISNGNCTKSIYVNSRREVLLICAHPINEEEINENEAQPKPIQVSAKVFQEAVKQKSVTAELIQSEKDRLTKRESRSKELDEIKLQENIYDAFNQTEALKRADHPEGKFDKPIGIFLLYNGLSWGAKKRFQSMVFGEDQEDQSMDVLLEQFCLNATNTQLSILTRIALLDGSDAKSPKNQKGIWLRKMSENTEGFDVQALQNTQLQKVEERQKRLNQRLEQLDELAAGLVTTEATA